MENNSNKKDDGKKLPILFTDDPVEIDPYTEKGLERYKENLRTQGNKQYNFEIPKATLLDTE